MTKAPPMAEALTMLPPRRLHRATVRRTAMIGPYMKRITVDGHPHRAGRVLPAQWLKVFVPAVDGDPAPKGRAYTIRSVDPAAGTLDLDFVLHGDEGPASAWAARARTGDVIGLSDPHPRSGFAIDPAISSYLFFGDDTALPAIAGILEALSAIARARLFIEVADAAAELPLTSAAGLDITWLHRQGAPACSLDAALRDLAPPSDDTVVWMAGEASAIAALRAHALGEWHLGRHRLHAAGYWKSGQPAFKDRDD